MPIGPSGRASINSVVFSYFEWRAAEEENGADFLEECAQFGEGRERFLADAKVHRTRAENIRASLGLRPRIVTVELALFTRAYHVSFPVQSRLAAGISFTL
jgi:hypothetical protein